MLINIQFLRFAAALLVVLYHSAARVPQSGDWLHGLFSVSAATGFAGVDVFFVISGFIMAYTTMSSAGGGTAWNFARRRLARIYSGYWPFYFLTALVFAWSRPQHFAEADLLASFFLIPQTLNRNLLEISWTLSYELYFYLLFTLLVWALRPRQRMPACVALAASLLTWNLVRHIWFGSFGPEKLYSLGFWDQFLTSPYILEFLSGSVLAYWITGRDRGPGVRLLILGVTVFLAGGAVNCWIFAGNLEQGFHVVPRVAIFGTASVMIVAGLVFMERDGRTAPRKFSLLTGGASYAIYLSHIPLLSATHQLGFGRWAASQPFGLLTMGYGILVTVIAGLSCLHYRLIERRLHRLFRNALGVNRPNRI